MALDPGARLGPYEILQSLGAGGMGEVYRAHHTKLRRDVAIKVLPQDLPGGAWRRSRFEREARAASSLNHPNIVTIYDIAEQGGTTYIAMELVQGRTLRELIAQGPIPIDQALGYAEQIAAGLARAHEAGVLHRDIKPANLMVTREGVVKILDFGLAKPLPQAEARDGVPATTATQEGLILGTPHYMSPEQCAGDALDHRSDQFALGVVLYEMVGGRPPFDGPSVRAIMSAILVEPPASLRHLRPDVPADLERIIGRCLEKDADRRYASMAELSGELRRLTARRAGATRGVRGLLRRTPVRIALAATVLAVIAGAAVWVHGAGRRWAGGEALSEITRLSERGELYQAYHTALEAEHYRPGDPALQQVVDRITLPISVRTDPPGAQVLVKGYATPDAPWEPVGVTPLQLRIPYALMRWKITKAGYEPFEGAPFGGGSLEALGKGLSLDSAGTRPPGMVHVPGGPATGMLGAEQPGGGSPIPPIAPFFLDRYEVTNRAFQEFVNAGGYQNRKYWPDSIQDSGRRLSWGQAIARFVDATGRPGPATWVAGSYPAGRDDYPVSGISWYEAAAYCAYAGKSLPTVYHWFRAIGQDQLSDILRFSNMEGEGKAPVGQFQGLGAYGTYDMAGNVREWAWNATGNDRFILGGAWNEPYYVFRHLIAQDPMRREATDGVRCARYPTPVPARLLGAIAVVRHYHVPPPLSPDAFALVRSVYSYDHTPLDARVEREIDSLPDYHREVVSIRTAYGTGRMEVNLLIPRNASPPYQAVIWFPGGDVSLLRSSRTFASEYLFDFIPRGGRVLVYPIYKGMYERFEPPDFSPGALRDRMIRWAQDISRTIDYLGTRADIDTAKIAYYGLSSGAAFGPAFTAVEPRFKASILLGGGLIPIPFLPEVSPAALAPWSRTPTLMISGRDDFIMPYELSEKPLFDLLGAPGAEKRLARLDGGHIPTDRFEVIREVLDWLDRYLGPVQRSASVARAGG